MLFDEVGLVLFDDGVAPDLVGGLPQAVAVGFGELLG